MLYSIFDDPVDNVRHYDDTWDNDVMEASLVDDKEVQCGD